MRQEKFARINNQSSLAFLRIGSIARGKQANAFLPSSFLFNNNYSQRVFRLKPTLCVTRETYISPFPMINL